MQVPLQEWYTQFYYFFRGECWIFFSLCWQDDNVHRVEVEEKWEHLKLTNPEHILWNPGGQHELLAISRAGAEQLFGARAAHELEFGHRDIGDLGNGISIIWYLPNPNTYTRPRPFHSSPKMPRKNNFRENKKRNVFNGITRIIVLVWNLFLWYSI